MTTKALLFIAWMRLPPSRRWQAVGTAESEAEADCLLRAAAKGHRLVDLMVLRAGERPDQRPRR